MFIPRAKATGKANIVLRIARKVLPAKDMLLHIPALSGGNFSAMLVKI
jgi:hypothetical protein